MKQFVIFLCFFSLLTNTDVLGQKISETNLEIGFNKLLSTDFNRYYDEECSPPKFLVFGISHFWYRTDKKISFNKEIGLNLQHSSPELSSGGLGAHWYGKQKLLNLFAEATVQAQFRIDSILSIGFGPSVEYLILGYNELHSSYYMVTNPPTSGEYSNSGFNRDYYSDPIFGVRLSMLNSNIGNRATLRLNLSYFWMKENDSNFHSSNYIKFGVAIGFRHKRELTNSKIE